MRLIGVAVVSIGVLALSSPRIGAAGDNWPQWRGPAGRGVSDAAGYPDDGARQEHRVEDGDRRAAATRPRSSGTTASS